MKRDLFGLNGPIMDDYERWYLNNDADEWPDDGDTEDIMNQDSAIIYVFTDVLDKLDELNQIVDDLKLVTGIEILNVQKDLHVRNIQHLELLAKEFDKQITITPLKIQSVFTTEHSITINEIKVYCYD